MNVTLLKSIKALVLDVDGVLTNGQTWLDQEGEWRRFFFIQDGIGLKALVRSGFRVGLITGSKGRDIAERAKNLGLHATILGVEDKWPAFEGLLKEWELDAHQVAYMGDDIPDLPILQKVAWGITVPNAHPDILNTADLYCTRRRGGQGAVREVCDMLIESSQKES